MIVKYTLENRVTTSNVGAGLTAPECIDDGGYFLDITDNTYIGYCDGTHPLCPTCTEITEVELEARKLKVANTHECAVRSDGRYSYVEALDGATNSFMVAKAYPSNAITHYYKTGDPTCEFYSERTEGRKKYWSSGNTPTACDSYSPPDSDTQLLLGYGEIEGVTQEWSYMFTTFESMMYFVNNHNPITLPLTLEVSMKNNPSAVRPDAIKNPDFMCLASLEVTASGDEITTIYVKAELEDVFS